MKNIELYEAANTGGDGREVRFLLPTGEWTRVMYAGVSQTEVLPEASEDYIQYGLYTESTVGKHNDTRGYHGIVEPLHLRTLASKMSNAAFANGAPNGRPLRNKFMPGVLLLDWDESSGLWVRYPILSVGHTPVGAAMYRGTHEPHRVMSDPNRPAVCLYTTPTPAREFGWAHFEKLDPDYESTTYDEPCGQCA